MIVYPINQRSASFIRIATLLQVILPCLIGFTAFSLTPQQIASNAFPSVVVVISQDGNGNDFAFGTGFFVAPGIIATNLHVIEGATKVRIRPIGTTDEHEVMGFTAVDYDNDLVLLETTVANIPPLKIGDDAATAIGDDVYVIGNPVGLEGTFSKGMVSGKREVNAHKIIQITAPISSGSSGGPVLSVSGEVIGVAVAYIAEGQNLNFAVPSSVLSSAMKNQHEQKSLTLFESKNVKKVAPNDLDSPQTPISLGNVLLYLGMPEDEAVKKIGAYYKVLKLSGLDGNDTGNYAILEIVNASDNVLGEAIGQINCKDGKVVSISRGFGGASVSDDMVKLFMSAEARLEELKKNGKTFCVIDCKSDKIDLENSPFGQYQITLKFDNYSLKIGVNINPGENFFIVDETLEQ